MPFFEKTQNTKRNLLFGVIKSAVSIILPFFTRTVIISRFGIQYAGLNSLFASVLTVLNLTEAGFGTAIIYSLFKPVAENDVDTICAYLNHYKKVYRKIGIIILLLGILLIPLLPYLVLDNTMPGDLNLSTCYLIFLIDSVSGYLLFGYMTAIPSAFQRTDLLNKIDTLLAVVKNAVFIMLLISFDSFYCYLVSIPILTCVRNLVNAWNIHRHYPAYVCRGGLDAEQKTKLKKKNIGLFLAKLEGTCRNSIDSLCISAFIGLTATGIYNNYYIILDAVKGMGGVFYHSVLSSVGNSMVTGSKEKNYADMRRFDFMYCGIAGCAAVCLLCLYQPFMLLWVGREQMLGYAEVLGLCLYIYILNSGDMRWVYSDAAGLWWEYRYMTLAEGLSNLILNVVFCKFWGILGIIIATDVSMFIFNLVLAPVILYREYFQNGKLMQFYSDHLLYFLTLIPVAVLSFFLCGRIPFDGIPGFALKAAAAFIISAGGYIAIWHRSRLFADAADWIRQRIPVNRKQG